MNEETWGKTQKKGRLTLAAQEKKQEYEVNSVCVRERERERERPCWQ